MFPRSPVPKLLATSFPAAVLFGLASCAVPVRPTADGAETCTPTDANRPVCFSAMSAEAATFVDPTATIQSPESVVLAPQVYVDPFARLLATPSSEIRIGRESNVQDNVTLDARKGVVEIGGRVIAAHGSSVLGPARVGVEEGASAGHDEEISVFLSFGARVDGAILEPNTGVSALARVGPGVRLRSGFLVLPGKNVTTQEEADDPALGKVRPINEADIAFNEAVIEVNVALAREYARLFRDDPSFVQGINYDPGNTAFNPERHLPTFSDSDVQDPTFRNRVIGQVNLGGSKEQVASAMGNRISLRADEGEEFRVGRIARMSDDVVFHALEHSNLVIGDGVTYGERAIVHGGGRVIEEGQPEGQTTVGDNVRLGDGAVVFRSTIGAGSTVGRRSAVVGSDVPPGTVIPDGVIYLNDEIFGPVEW